MFKQSLIATAVTSAAALAIASPAIAATGHSATATGGSPLGASGALTAYTGSLFGQDGAGSITFVTSIGTITCTTGTAGGTIVSDGGAAYPIGGTGPTGNLSALSFTNGGAACTSNIASLGNPTATTTVVDSNGASAGLLDVQGDWNAGAPRMTFLNPIVDVKLSTLPTACRYQATAGVSGSVNNAAAGVPSLTFASQSLARIAGPATCPTSGQFNGTFGLSRSATLAQPVYLTA